MKICTKCGESKSLDRYPKKSNGRPKASCKDCVNVYMKNYYRSNPDKKLRHRLYQLKHVDFGERDPLSVLGSVCVICNMSVADTIDHCHASGRYRNTICRDCNLMLGHAKDNQNTLLSAIEYLQTY